MAKFLRHTALDPRTLAGLYSVDPGGKVALRTLPTTAQRLRDAFLLLLYGLLTLRGEWPVTGITLMRAARISGIELERVPRDFARDSELVTAFGRRRGKRYRLTLAGLRHCERLIPGMVADVGE